MREPDREHAGELLAAAERDFATLQVGLREPTLPDEVFGFHPQQAVEKMIKARLAIFGAEIPRIHDIVRLAGLLAQHVGSQSDFEDLYPLNAFAVVLRYEVCDADFQLDREWMVARVSQLLAAARRAVADSNAA